MIAAQSKWKGHGRQESG